MNFEVKKVLFSLMSGVIVTIISIIRDYGRIKTMFLSVLFSFVCYILISYFFNQKIDDMFDKIK